jgi:hypothetical protein
VEEFASSDKSQQVFDAALAGYGVLALFITLANHGLTEYAVEHGSIRAYLGTQPLPALPAKEAAAQSTVRVFEMRLKGQDIAYTLMTLTPPGWVVVSSHWLHCLGNTECSFNQERERRKHAIEYDRKNIPLHFEKLELRDALLPPGGRAAGFMYFKLPDDRNNQLNRITLEVIATDRRHGTEARYHFSFSP